MSLARRIAALGPPPFDFTRGVLPPGATLTRADASTCATYVNSAGLIATAAANVPRFTHDHLGNMQGMLVEPASTNSFTNSADLTQASWLKINLTAPGGADDPAGGTAAVSLTEDSADTAKRIQPNSVDTVSASVYPISLFCKEITSSRWFQIAPNGGNGRENFQPSTGALGASTNMAGAIAVQLANGWWRFGGLYTSASTGSFGQRFYLLNGDNGTGANYTGDGTAKIAVYGGQYEPAGNPITSFIVTEGSAKTRAADVLALAVPNGTYTVAIERLSGNTILFGQSVTLGTYTVPTDVSPLRRVTLRKVA